VARFSLSISLQVSSVGDLGSFPFPLVFHNNIWESRPVHSVDVSFPFVFVIADFFQNWLYFEFFHDVLIPLVVKQCVFLVFSQKCHLSCCGSGFALFL
jgi:hypothetical protein